MGFTEEIRPLLMLLLRVHLRTCGLAPEALREFASLGGPPGPAGQHHLTSVACAKAPSHAVSSVSFPKWERRYFKLFAGRRDFLTVIQPPHGSLYAPFSPVPPCFHTPSPRHSLPGFSCMTPPKCVGVAVGG